MDQFDFHVQLIRAENPDLKVGEARFRAWVEGEQGLKERMTEINKKIGVEE